MKLMLAAMGELGHEIPLEDVEKFADGALGRPHLARAMIEHGIVETISEAFEQYIETGHLHSEKGRCPQLLKPFKWCINPEE